MIEVEETDHGPLEGANTRYDGVCKEVAAEILSHAQAMAAAQYTGVDAVNSKLTGVLGQAVQIATIALGAASLPLAEKAWMPAWAGIGLAAAGVCAAGAALPAWWALRLRRWGAPGLSPENTAIPAVLEATPQTAMMFMANAYQAAISENKAGVDVLENYLNQALTLLAITPGIGLAAAGVTAYLLGGR